MTCPYCNQATKMGKAAFSSLQPFVQMVVSYTSEEEAKKPFFKRESKNRVVLPGDELQACYCPACGKVILSFDAE